MRISLTGEDRVLLDRYIESILLRFSDNRYSLGEATQELAGTFVQVAAGEPDWLVHIRGVVEAGDDA